MKVKVNVDEGHDVASYSTDKPPTYVSVTVPSSDPQQEDGRIVFCQFVPLNGHDKGKLLQVPFSRIVSISGAA